MKLLNTIFIFSTIVLISCSENPFFKDENVSDQTTIRGTVVLNKGTSSQNVFVWLQNTDTSTRTDEHGQFNLRIPPANKQEGGKFNGSYNLYFFMANYSLDSARVLFRNGILVWGEGDLNTKGEINNTITLDKILDIKTKLNTPSISNTYEGNITGTITLQASKDSVLVKIFQATRDTVTTYLFHNVNQSTSAVVIINSFCNEKSEKFVYVKQSPITLSILQEWPPIQNGNSVNFAAGSYRIYPFIIVVRVLPAGFYDQLQEFVEINSNYMDYPIEGTTDILNIN